MSKRLTTCAIAVTALTVALTTGSTTAHSAGAGVLQSFDPVVNEVNIDAGPGTFAELTNLGDAGNLDNWRLAVCNRTTSSIIEFDSAHEIELGEFLLIAGPSYSDPGGDTPDVVTNIVELLNEDDSAVYLTDLVTGGVDGVFWGQPTACSSSDLVQLLEIDAPTSTQSAQRNASPPPPWCLGSPTPGGQNVTC